MELKIEYVPIELITPYERNAKLHPQEQIEQIKRSIQEFGFNDPLAVDKNNIIIEGHGRYIACKELGIKEVPIIRLDELTNEQRKAYTLVHNKLTMNSGFDFDLLQEELDSIFDVDMSDFGFDIDVESDEFIEHTSLVDEFIIPPFSVLDTRQGYWQDRKKMWKDFGIKSELGRSKNLTYAVDKSDYMKTGCKGVAVQTSIFDPVLCEIMYKWFGIDGGTVYDCFAGGSVRGIVAERLGYKYIGVDIRQEQVDANYKNASDIGVSPTWICDDSRNADRYIENESVDMIFTCPPYHDLEVYSDNPNDISNMDYEDFCNAYKQIIEIACKKLKNDRFAVFVVGDVRDKKGVYRNFVDYTKDCFIKNGLQTYNELILIEQSGTASIRAKRQFGSLRKVVKTHQNVLVFYKGDVKKIKQNFKEIEISDI